MVKLKKLDGGIVWPTAIDYAIDAVVVNGKSNQKRSRLLSWFGYNTYWNAHLCSHLGVTL